MNTATPPNSDQRAAEPPLVAPIQDGGAPSNRQKIVFAILMVLAVLFLVFKGMYGSNPTGETVKQQAEEFRARQLNAPQPPRQTPPPPPETAPSSPALSHDDMPEDLKRALLAMALAQQEKKSAYDQQKAEAAAAAAAAAAEERRKRMDDRRRSPIALAGSSGVATGTGKGEPSSSSSSFADQIAQARAAAAGMGASSQPPPQPPQAFGFSSSAGSTQIDVVKAAYNGALAFRISAGKVIAAVGETAVNSDLPGPLRALVSEDVYSEDGSQILIPRGSRLVGEYRSGLSIGQSRVFVIWHQIRRPDGVDITIASSGSDSEGASGLGGKVDRHYIQRFGAAVLLSLIDAYAETQGDGDRLQVAGNATNAAVSQALTQQANIPPTVRVPKGHPITIMVQRDLNFADIVRDGFVVRSN